MDNELFGRPRFTNASKMEDQQSVEGWAIGTKQNQYGGLDILMVGPQGEFTLWTAGKLKKLATALATDKTGEYLNRYYRITRVVADDFMTRYNKMSQGFMIVPVAEKGIFGQTAAKTVGPVTDAIEYEDVREDEPSGTDKIPF